MSNAHHPQIVGLTEAANQVVEMVLRCTLYSTSKPTHWVRDLSLFEFVINNSPSIATKYTLFYFNYGYFPATPLDLLRDSETIAVEGVNNFVQRLEQTFKRASHMLQRA